MKKSGTVTPTSHVKLGRPAITPENREQQLVAMATDLLEQRLADGTASSQEVTTILKQGSIKAQLEREILQLQKELIAAKTEAIRREEHKEALFKEAIEAMKRYSGANRNDEDDD